VPLQEPIARSQPQGVVDRQWPTGDPGDPDDLGTMLWLCSDRVTPDDIEQFGGKAEVDDICVGLDMLRDACREHPPQANSGDAADAYMAKRCADLQRLDGKWPPPAR
jgi:hypothetical protein